MHAVDTSESIYPSALVTAWVDQETRGTDALKHERLILVSGWVLYVVLVATAILRQRVDLAVSNIALETDAGIQLPRPPIANVRR